MALIHIDAVSKVPGQLTDVRVAKGEYCFVVLGELDERLLHGVSIGKPCFFPIASDGTAEGSVIAAVEQVKNLARMSRSHHLEVLSDTYRSCS